MIERDNRYIALRQQGTAFLDAFGFYPIDYFGCVGDNQTDNYANLQVAINESIKQGNKYLFVPNGSFYYTGTLTDTDKITFVGNSGYAKIYKKNGSTEVKIPIYQIGTQVPYEHGYFKLTKEVTGDGYIDIPVLTKKGIEAIIIFYDEETKVLYANNGLNTVNGVLYDEYENPLSLGTGVNLYLVTLPENAIRIRYKGSGTLDIDIEWRVR